MRKFKPQKLDDTTIREAQRLLGSGLNKTLIRRKLGIGKGSLDRIALGQLQANEEACTKRCGGCGGLQQMPCQVCETRAQIAA